MRRRGPLFEIWWLADLLRLVSSVSLVALALALFWQPIRQVMGPSVSSVVKRTPLSGVLGTGAEKGFTVRVVSEPRGAKVTIDGAERGKTPLFGNVPCRDGQEVRIVVEGAGYAPWVRKVRCRVGGELTVQARLEK